MFGKSWYERNFLKDIYSLERMMTHSANKPSISPLKFLIILVALMSTCVKYSNKNTGHQRISWLENEITANNIWSVVLFSLESFSYENKGHIYRYIVPYEDFFSMQFVKMGQAVATSSIYFFCCMLSWSWVHYSSTCQ